MPKRIKASPQAPHRVVAVAYDRLCTFEYGIVAEVFGSRRPGLPENWYEFRTAAGEAGRLRAHGSLAVEADGGLDLLQGAGTIIVPGWRGLAEPVPEPLAGALRAAHRGGSRVVSICGGAYVLDRSPMLVCCAPVLTPTYKTLVSKDHAPNCCVKAAPNNQSHEPVPG